MFNDYASWEIAKQRAIDYQAEAEADRRWRAPLHVNARPRTRRSIRTLAGLLRRAALSVIHSPARILVR